MEIQEAIGSIVLNLRKKRKIYQVDLGMQYDQSQISRVENGKQWPSEDFILQFCEVLEMPTSEFFFAVGKYLKEKERMD